MAGFSRDQPDLGLYRRIADGEAIGFQLRPKIRHRHSNAELKIIRDPDAHIDPGFAFEIHAGDGAVRIGEDFVFASRQRPRIVRGKGNIRQRRRGQRRQPQGRGSYNGLHEARQSRQSDALAPAEVRQRNFVEFHKRRSPEHAAKIPRNMCSVGPAHVTR